MHKQHLVLWMSAFALLSVSGCNDAASEDCADVVGVYQASYQQLEGSCTPTFEGQSLEVDQGSKGTITKTETRLADKIRTTLVFKGCSLGIQQAALDNAVEGKTMWELKGDLQVDSASTLSGMLTRTVYMDDGAIACNGVYEASYSRSDSVLGGAAQHAGATP